MSSPAHLPPTSLRVSTPWRALLVVPLLAVLAGCQSAPRAEARPFAWPSEAPAPVVSGEKGPAGVPVTLAAVPSAEWTAVSTLAPGVERDRAAIHALAGDFRVTFDFQETISYRPGQPLQAPYHSWATERVFAIADTPGYIALQHQLVIRSVDDPAKAVVVKHWREDWTYEDTKVLVFRGKGKWQLDTRDAASVAGSWTQAVYGTEDEPRYEALGRWRHDGATSQWISERQWRPLPRREYSIRKDYHALDGIQRLVITPNGWVQWQDNAKLPLAAAAQAEASGPLAQEIGCARYERITGFDWTPGVTAWQADQAYWTKVRAAWDEKIAAAGTGLLDRQEIAAEITTKVGDAPSAKP